MEQIIASIKGRKTLDRKTRIAYTAQVAYIQGNSAPHYSLTGEIHEAVDGCWELSCCGCIHEDILKAWPDDAFLVLMSRIHLSDFPTGTPMYALENGYFWYSEVYGQNITHLASTLRIEPELAALIPDGLTKEQFLVEIIEPLREQWAFESKTAWDVFLSRGTVCRTLFYRLNEIHRFGFKLEAQHG